MDSDSDRGVNNHRFNGTVAGTFPQTPYLCLGTRFDNLNISVMTQILSLSQKATVSCLMFKPQDFLALIKAQGLSSQHYLPVFQFGRLMLNASLLHFSK